MHKNTYTSDRKKIRIAMLSLHASPLGILGTHDTGGMSVYVREISAEIGRKGHIIDVFTIAKEATARGMVPLSDNVRLIHLDCGVSGEVNKNDLHLCVPEFFRSLESYRKGTETRYDVVHSHYWLSGLAGSRARRCWNTPHFITFHTTGIAKMTRCAEEQEPTVRITAEKDLSRECSRILVSSEPERDALVQYYNVPSAKVSLIPCGVNTGRFYPVPKDTARAETGLHPSGPVILYVGRFTPVKGIERLMAAIAHLNHIPDLRFLIIGGDGDLSPACRSLRQLANGLNIADRVSFMGRVDHDRLALYYSAADVLAVPSYYESFGLVALEALSCGTPVVATRVGAMDNIILEGRTGTVVDDASPGSLANAIEKFITRPVGRESAREEVRASVLQHSWANAAASLIGEYRSILDGLVIEQRNAKN